MNKLVLALGMCLISITSAQKLNAYHYPYVGHGPTMPPDPWEPILVTHGPTMPPGPDEPFRLKGWPTSRLQPLSLVRVPNSTP
jgi:hypothetical protein